MRGKAPAHPISGSAARITLAYAGKRAHLPRLWHLCWDHPRVCGEKGTGAGSWAAAEGSPPRMRGKGCIEWLKECQRRITPAYAGKRKLRPRAGKLTRDHPRVCGEKTKITNIIRRATGSPPRMRGKGVEELQQLIDSRITPAYAGKSHDYLNCVYQRRDHPRVCGEKTLKC